MSDNLGKITRGLEQMRNRKADGRPRVFVIDVSNLNAHLRTSQTRIRGSREKRAEREALMGCAPTPRGMRHNFASVPILNGAPPL